MNKQYGQKGKIAGMVVAVVLSSLPAGVSLAAVACGDTVSGKAEMMFSDLTCVASPGITLTNGATLDMGGHKLTCNATAVGVQMSGSGAKLLNGVIDGCSASDVAVGGNGGHVLTDVVLTNGSEGASVSSPGNTFTRVLAYSSGGAGFGIVSDGNRFVNCVSSDSTGGSGFHVSGGNKNSFSGCIASGNKFEGFLINFGNGQKLKQNTATDNSQSGFQLNGDGAKAIKNIAVRNSVDGFLVSGNGNTLKQNRADFSLIGFEVTGSNNSLSQNVATENQGGFYNNGGSNTNLTYNQSLLSLAGIVSHNGSGTISKNKSIGGATDLEDDNACAMTTWSGNVFATKLDGCEQ